MPSTPQKNSQRKNNSPLTQKYLHSQTAAPKTNAPKTTDEINTLPMQEGDELVYFKAFKAAGYLDGVARPGSHFSKILPIGIPAPAHNKIK